MSRGCFVVTAAVLLVAGCTVPEPRPPATNWAIIDADAHGAIIFGGPDNEYRGVRRDGTTMWFTKTGPPVVGCMRVCPDAIPSTLDFARSVLWADSAQNMVSVKGTELDLAGHPIRVGGQYTSWQTSADGQHALALTTLAVRLNVEARWFDLTPGGWRLSAPVVTVPGPRDRACVSPDGRRAVLLGQAPSLLERDGYQTKIPEIESASGCAFTRLHTLVVELAGAGGLNRSRLRALGPAGEVVWRLDFVGRVTVCGDVNSGRVLWVLAGVLYEADVGHEVTQRSIPGVSAACYDGGGGVVVVDPSGGARWLD
ncbi:MAG TPA: hypothetical protein VFC19_45265 [Candidatus Limnocylindrales bacterium]|nr:hypothetical protein [Candidatus Limnocylindrales bacterium]